MLAIERDAQEFGFVLSIATPWLTTILAAVPAAGTAPADHLNVPTWYWFAFCAVTVILLILDMTVFHRKSHEPTLRESALWTLFWCGLALAFNAWLWWWAVQEQGPAGAKHGLANLCVLRVSAVNINTPRTPAVPVLD
jgi:hypothetical protein